MRSRVVATLLAVCCLAPIGAATADDTPEMDRTVEPVILTGAQFPGWSAGADPTLREPQAPTDPLDQSDCADDEYPYGDSGRHNCYESSRLPRNPVEGAPVERLLGYRWDADAEAFVQIPFQVDERFTRYLTNNASGFAFYSTADQHNTYAFDREGFRFTDDAPHPVTGEDCIAAPRDGVATTPDPVKGLDDDDELVFMWRDAGDKAPPGTPLPAGVVGAREIAVSDPLNPAEPAFAYVMLAGPDGPEPAFDASNGYVRYQRDANADVFVFSESSYEDYGAAARGPYCTPDGARDLSKGEYAQRRPLDTAWVRTPRYAFRYDGRWLMTQLRVSDDKDGDWTYGEDLIDRWKARAFAQDPSSETPCCGYEEEDTNWGGSSILMGERWGPVRVIRETWGADSSTNNARREVFYRDLFVWGDALRVHPIPPLDGIYSQWDYNAGAVSTYYNPHVPDGVAIDGQNDEVFGNLDDPCNTRYDGRGTTPDETYRQTYRGAGLCALPYHQSVDVSDPTFSGAQALLWEQIAGPNGSLVLRTTIREHTPGGTAQSLVAVPYYRDDACFDDGTGTNPGPKVNLRSGNEPLTYTDLDGVEHPRKCWAPGDPIDEGFTAQNDRPGDERYFQGSIATHGLHLLFVAESDNAFTTLPLTEIDSEQRIVVLPGDAGNVGERYGRYLEFPLRATSAPYAG